MPKAEPVRLMPYRCPVCSDSEYYGRLAKPGTRETCPNHASVRTDPDTGERVQEVDIVFLVPVRE